MQFKTCMQLVQSADIFIIYYLRLNQVKIDTLSAQYSEN